MEEWRPVEGYEGYYEVSNTGRVRSLNYNHTGKPRDLKPKIDRYGYKVVHIHRGKTHKHLTVHRLVAIAFLPRRDGCNQVNHIDCNKQNNHVDNLEWCSNLENMQHADRNGLMKNLRLASKNRRKAVMLRRIVDGKTFKFESLTKAGEFLGLMAHRVSYVANGNAKIVHGYTAEFI